MNTNSKRKNSVSFSKLLQVILFVVCCTGSSIAWGQETLTVHDGTVENTYIPMYVGWFDDYTRSQFVIPANDLTDMAGGTISQITFYVKNTNIPYTTLPEVDIYMTEVASTTISSFVAKSSATIVYTGTVSFQSTGIATITLDTPYQYTGGNLLIGCENISDDGYKFIYFYGETVTGASIAGYDGTSTANVTATQRDFIPKTTFTYTHNCTQPTGNFAFSPSSSNLLIGNNLNISTNLTNTLPSGGSIAYTSSNTGVATVNASGVVTGVAEGTATITAKWTHDNFCSKSATFTVNVNDGCLRIGDGTSTTSTAPLYGNYNNSYVQMIYTAAEIGGGGTINSIAFNSSASNSQARNLRVYMGLTTKSSFSSSTDYVSINDLTEVYSDGSWTVDAGWNIFELTTPFEYSNDQNLVIALYNTATGFSSTSFYYTTTTNSQVVYAYSDSADPNPTTYNNNWSSYSGYKSTSTSRPNVKICIESCTNPEFSLSSTSGSVLVTNTKNISSYLQNTHGATPTYTSNNTSVATVSASGVITGVSAGSTTITVSIPANGDYCAATATYTVTVTCNAPTLSLSESSGEIVIGDEEDITLTNPNNTTVTWTSANTGIATVTGDNTSATIRGIAAGTTTITASIPASGTYCAKEVNYTVTVNRDCYEQITMDDMTKEIECGKTYCFFDDGGEENEYSSINTSQTATFTSSGNITINFESFVTESSSSCSNTWDYMLAYDGDAATGTLLFRGQTGCSTNALIIGQNYTATSGTLTIVWQTDGSVTKDGWVATITASGCCTNPNFSLSSTSGSVLVTNTKNISSYLQNTQGATPTYTSNGTGVATVDANGVITGVSTGSTTITVSIPANGDYCAATATYTIDVTCEEPTLTLSETTGSALIGENKTVTLTNPSNANVTWTATNASVATVTGNNTGATIHAVGNGTTTIKASIPASGTNCAKEVTYTITVSCTSRTFTFNQSSVNCGVGSSVSAPGYTVSGGNGTVTYSSSNTSVATVNANTGIVTGVAEGSATITATISASAPYCPQTATFTVNVSPCGFTTKTIGTGTSTSYNNGTPVCTYNYYTYTQIIYTSSELTAGTIYSIAFQYAYSTNLTAKTDVVIYMGETNKDAFNNNSDWITSGLTQVYSGNLNCSNGWNWFTLNNPFNYSGTKNLVVVIDDNSGSRHNTNYTFYYSSTPGNKFISYYSNTNNYNNTSISGHNSSIRNSNRPNTKFCIAKQYTLTYEAETTTCDGTASNEPAPLTRPEGSVVQITFQRPTCSDTRCTFVGWSTNEDGTGTIYQPGDQYTLNSDVTLYAKYSKCFAISNFAIDADNENYTQTIDGIPYFSICLGNEITLKTSPSSIANVAKCKWYINAHDGNAPTSETRSGLWNKTYTPSTETGHDVSLVVTKTDGCAYYASARIKVSAGLSPTNSTPDAGEICIGSGKDITVGTQAAGSTIEVEDAPIEVSAVLGEGVETFIPDGPNCDQGLCYESAVTFYDFDEAATIETANNINYVRINMEHSHIGDMQIKLTCPNGQSAILLEDANTSSQSLDEYSYDWPYNVIYCYGLFNIYNNVGGDGNCSKGTSLGQDYKEIYVIKNGNTYSATGVRQEATAFTGTLSNALLEEYIVYLRGLIAAQSVPADFCYGDKYYEFNSYVVTNPYFYTTTVAENYDGGYNLSNYVRPNMWCTDVASLGFGKPNVLDAVADANVCNSTYNHPGEGLDYCWSNNSTYTYAGGLYGYVHETANHQVGYTNSMMVKPSNMTDMTQIYHPKESFDGLIGCPLNGTWKISVCDSWRFDNGYIFNWELALNDVTLNSWDYTITLADVEVETDNIVSATSTPSVFNIHPTEANANSIIGVEQNNSITLIDNLGCRNEGIGFTYTVTQPVIPAVINETICLGTSVDLTASNGSSTSSAATAPYTYAWSTDASLSANNTQTVTATPTWTSTYTVSMTDNAGCSGTNLATVSVTAPAQQETSDYFIWTGKGTNNTNWGDADNWAKYNYANTRYENVTGAPTSADNVYVIGNSTCTTTSPTVNVDGAAKNLKIGNGFSVNGGSHNLSLAGNLDMYATNSFVPATGKVSFIGNSDQTINKAITFYDVVFNQNSVNTITAPSMTINHNATFTKGIVNNDVSFIANSTVTNANTLTYDSYVDGTVTKTTGSSVAETFTFPTGGDLTNDPTNFVLGTVKTEIPKNQEVSVKFNHKSTDGGFTTGDMPKWWGASSMCSAEVNGSDDLPRIDHASNAEFWEITTPITLSNVTMTAYSEDGDILQFNENTQDHNASSIVGTVYNSSYYCWQNMGGTATVSSVTRSGQYNKISLSGFSIPAGGGGFTTFGSLNGNTILPIELKDFYAECNGNNVATVEWTTATEHDNDYFILERSHDAKNFTEIARIQGAGYSASEKFYQYIDNELYSGDNYYRLVQVDFDGVKTTSEIITIKCNETFGDPNVEAYPNPFNNEITVVLENFGNVPAQIEVFDVLGKLIRVEKIESTLDEYITTYDFSNLAPATYNMRVSTSDFVIVKQIIKQ